MQFEFNTDRICWISSIIWLAEYIGLVAEILWIRAKPKPLAIHKTSDQSVMPLAGNGTKQVIAIDLSYNI